MFILGFNEIMALLGNPLLLFLFVVLGVMAYAAWLAGLLDVPIRIAQGTFAQFLSVVRNMTHHGSCTQSSELVGDVTGRAKNAAVQSVMSRITGAPAPVGKKND